MFHIGLAKGIILLWFLALTGCNTYRLLEPEDRKHGKLLYWQVSAPPMDVNLHSVVVPGGPGSWVKGARWDEYQVQITNTGPVPLVVQTSYLVDFQGTMQPAGDDITRLEKQSATNWSRYGKASLLVAGVGGWAAGYGVLAGSATVSTAGAVGIVASPFVALAMTDEFAQVRRDAPRLHASFDAWRFKLPLTLAPGATMKRSFFFPLTPGPQRLVIHGLAGDQPVDAVLELKPLAALHFRSAKGSQ